MLSRSKALVALDVLAVLTTIVRIVSGLDVIPPAKHPELKCEVKAAPYHWDLKRLPPVESEQAL